MMLLQSLAFFSLFIIPVLLIFICEYLSKASYDFKIGYPKRCNSIKISFLIFLKYYNKNKDNWILSSTYAVKVHEEEKMYFTFSFLNYLFYRNFYKKCCSINIKKIEKKRKKEALNKLKKWSENNNEPI